MLACVSAIAQTYHLPVAAIERVITRAARSHTGIGPMGIPQQWLPVLAVYHFPVALVRTTPCWGVAGGAWILALGHRFVGDAGVTTNTLAIPTIPATYRKIAVQAGAHYGVPVPLIIAVMAQESGFDAQAVSAAGARGLMQLMPATASRFGVSNPFSARQSIWGGTAYLAELLDRFHHNIRLTLAGYNAGGQAVARWGYHVPPYRQTQTYVPQVMARMAGITAEASAQK
ncbi:MAG: transglycosylase SLT domain-containing protein [Acidiphilium sp.]|nr:transglycosylase SLT domain-containing protein [Acidiphilium sp.]